MTPATGDGEKDRGALEVEGGLVMADYDFSGLSPSDFEALCRDLLQQALSVPLQSFTTGRDRGIDLRYAPVSLRDWIVQCKHYACSGYSTLLSHMKAKELPKIKNLRPVDTSLQLQSV